MRATFVRAKKTFGGLDQTIKKIKNFRYVGRVGTGFSEITLKELSQKMRTLEQSHTPFGIQSPSGRSVHWLKPKLTAEIEFKAWIQEGILRQASFQGLRSDNQSSGSRHGF